MPWWDTAVWGSESSVAPSRGGPLAGFPVSLVALNSIFGAYGAAFSHAYGFEEASGNALDMATSGASDLTPSNSPTQGVSTGLINGDKGVTFTNGGTQGFAGSATDFNVTTGDMVMLLTLKCDALPTGDPGIVWKQTGSQYWRLLLQSSGRIQFQTWDGTTAPTVTITVNHVNGAFVDVLVVLDRAAGTDRMAVVSNLGASSVATPSANTLSNNATQMLIGASGAGLTVTFFAWGTTVGSLLTAGTVTAMQAAISAWRTARGA